MKKYLLALLSFLSSSTFATPDASALAVKTTQMGGGLSSMVLSLFSVVLVLLVLYWLVKRYLAQRLGLTRVQSMKIISITMVGPKEKIVMIDTREGEALILGVTSHQITLLDKRPISVE